MFETERVSVALLEQLREQVARIEGGPSFSAPVPTHPELEPWVKVHAGGAYVVSSMSLAMLFMAGPSAQGAWSAVVGMPEFGCEAAAAVGVELARTVLVPDPGAQWLEVVTTLASAVDTVVLAPRSRVSDREAAIVRAKLRQHDAVLVSMGDWPRADAVVGEQRVEWTGLGAGHGHLRQRRAELQVRSRGSRLGHSRVS
jgi:hypothetical protein